MIQDTIGEESTKTLSNILQIAMNANFRALDSQNHRK